MDLYNNFCLVGLAINFMLQRNKSVSLSKAFLLAPFIMHADTMKYLKSSRKAVTNIDELIINKPGLFLNFNKRYYDSLLTSINAIQFLYDIDALELKDEMLVSKNIIPFDSKMGERMKLINQIIPFLADILNDDDKKLYLNLRVEL